MSWSRKYHTGLTDEQHKINDKWFEDMLRVLKGSGTLCVPSLCKYFNKQGEEVIEK